MPKREPYRLYVARDTTSPTHKDRAPEWVVRMSLPNGRPPRDLSHPTTSREHASIELARATMRANMLLLEELDRGR